MATLVVKSTKVLMATLAGERGKGRPELARVRGAGCGPQNRGSKIVGVAIFPSNLATVKHWHIEALYKS